MKLEPNENETIAGAARRLRSGDTTCVEILHGCLARLDDKEPDVRAWVMVDRESAEARARALDDELKAGRDHGPLHGIPIGIKDIIDVAGIPTQCGLAGRPWLKPIPPAKEDAPLVARLREAGAVILGKTVSTPFAWIDPPVTRNPWKLDRTPGGSSSGSAAAVACGMCLGAIGTQTGGSIIRPASFCGVAGMKPTYGHVSLRGVVPLAPSLDHAGPIARTVEDLEILYRAIKEPAAGSPAAASGHIEGRLPQLVLLRDYSTDGEDDAIDTAFRLLGERGAIRATRKFPVDRRVLLGCHRRILASEAAACHGHPWQLLFPYFTSQVSPNDFPQHLEALLREGMEVRATEYIDALKSRRPSTDFHDAAGPCDAFLACATLGPAPDTSTTGDPIFNSPWSLLGLPEVSFPVGLSADGLPLAVQLIGRMHEDLALLRTARWCESVIRSQGGFSA